MNAPDAAPLAVIAGLGKTGLSCARHLAARGWRLACTDTRPAPPGLAELQRIAPVAKVSTGTLDAALLEDAGLVVVSPGLPLDEPLFAAARARGIEVVGDVELFAREATAPVVAITGTNGKSTVTTLVGEMARHAGWDARVGGNLGTPALELLGGSPQLYVLELSSYQLESTSSLDLVAGAVLNLTPDHMDRYGGVGEYAAAKARIFARCAVAVVNLDDPRVATMPRPGQRIVGFSVDGHPAADWRLVSQDGADWLARGDEPWLATSDLRIAGRHNAANALAALALAEAAGLPRVAMLAALREFAGLPHRSQWVRDRRGVRWLDDSKGTNVGATLAAVQGLAGTLVLLAGGDGKNQDFAPLADALRGRVRLAVLIGRDARRLGAALAGACEVAYAGSMAEAVAVAAQGARPGDTVLLSPACASLDMFRDYAHRGEVFATAVRELQP
jgi:UDP-N-acetylmuramoylalanine--D-glutamate ligase